MTTTQEPIENIDIQEFEKLHIQFKKSQKEIEEIINNPNKKISKYCHLNSDSLSELCVILHDQVEKLYDMMNMSVKKITEHLEFLYDQK